MFHPAVPESFAATHHFAERSVLRQLRQDVLDLILEHGSRARASGVTHLTLLDRDLPPSLRGSAVARQARGWIVILSDAERLITCYRRGDASRFLRRKMKRRLSTKQVQRARERRRPGSRQRRLARAMGSRL